MYSRPSTGSKSESDVIESNPEMFSPSSLSVMFVSGVGTKTCVARMFFNESNGFSIKLHRFAPCWWRAAKLRSAPCVPSAELLGAMQLAKEWGLETGGDVYVDSAAALGVVKRKGNGKLRHIRVGQLWVQEKRETGELGYHKVDGKTNPSDVLTKAVSRQLMDRACELVGKCIADGRAVVGLHL